MGGPRADRGHKAHRRAEPEARLCGLGRVPRKGAPRQVPLPPLTPHRPALPPGPWGHVYTTIQLISTAVLRGLLGSREPGHPVPLNGMQDLGPAQRLPENPQGREAPASLSGSPGTTLQGRLGALWVWRLGPFEGGWGPCGCRGWGAGI